MFPVLTEEGDGDPMHNAVLADFSRCLHVRKRTSSSPSDLGNGTKVGEHAIRAKKLCNAYPCVKSGRKCTTSNKLGPYRPCCERLYAKIVKLERFFVPERKNI